MDLLVTKQLICRNSDEDISKREVSLRWKASSDMDLINLENFDCDDASRCESETVQVHVIEQVKESCANFFPVFPSSITQLDQRLYCCGKTQRLHLIHKSFFVTLGSSQIRQNGIE